MFAVHLRFRWEKRLENAVHISQVDIKAHIAVSHFLAVDWVVIWTDITFARERRDRDGVLQAGIRRAVAQSAIYIALKTDSTHH